MKRLMIAFMILFAFSIPAYAHMEMMGGQQGQMGEGMTGEGQQMPMMNCPRMQHISGQRMMMQDMMQMMMDMMNMQGKMMMGVKPSEKKKMMKDMTHMKEKMEKMMSMSKGMMHGMMGQPTDVLQNKLTCAEEWLKKAIDLHEIHIKDPKTATEASQMEMMDQMKKAYECITGACCGMSETSSKESESKETEKELSPKSDTHGH